MKKALNIVFIVIFLVCLHLSIRFILNEVYIGKYNDSNYDNSIVNYLMLINYPEEYVAHYNKGNNYYNLSDYSDAVNEYNKALRTVKGDRRCKVLINLSLSMLNLIDFNGKDVRAKLIEVQKVLLDSDCATVDNQGKNADAQKLYNEIEALLNSQGGGGGGGDDDPQDDPDDTPNPEDYDDIEKKLKQQQQQANDDRKSVNKRQYEYYNGKSW